jgi:hypothetical protein
MRSGLETERYQAWNDVAASFNRARRCGSIANPEVPVPVTTMISEVYEAFKEANVSDTSARKAAEAIAAYQTRFAGLDFKIEKIDGRLTLVMWHLAVLIGGVATLIIKAFA